MTELDRQIRTDIQMQVVAREKEIHLLFSEVSGDKMIPAYTSNFLLSASDALALSTLLADLAYEIETTLKPVGSALKAELIEKHRIKITKRIELMLNSTRFKKTVSNSVLAKKMTDVSLKDVFDL
jgi:hypothetical protein